MTMPSIYGPLPRSEAMAERRPRRRPVAGSMVLCRRTPSGNSPSNRFSEAVSGASSRVAVRYLSGSDSLAMVRHDLRYCSRNEPVV